MKRIRDGPGKRKVAVEAAFFAGQKAGMQTRKNQIESVPAKQDRLQEIRDKLCLMLMDSDVEMPQDPPLFQMPELQTAGARSQEQGKDPYRLSQMP